MIAPSTWLKNKMLENGATKDDVKSNKLYPLLNMIDEEMLDGLAKHVQEKERDLEIQEQRLLCSEERLKAREESLKAREDAINELCELNDDRAKNGYVFAQKMAKLLTDGMGDRAQESLSYIMWAYFAGENVKLHNPMDKEGE